jgi:hypothetical protein
VVWSWWRCSFHSLLSGIVVCHSCCHYSSSLSYYSFSLILLCLNAVIGGCPTLFLLNIKHARHDLEKNFTSSSSFLVEVKRTFINFLTAHHNLGSSIVTPSHLGDFTSKSNKCHKDWFTKLKCSQREYHSTLTWISHK